MELTNKQVIHKQFGKGKVARLADKFIIIHFPTGEKKFLFPDAFESYLTMTDQRAADSINNIIQKIEEKRAEEAAIHEKERILEQVEEQRISKRDLMMKSRKLHPCSQAAFRCEPDEKSKILNEWKVFAGNVSSGKSQGQPNQLVRLYENSACLLTAKDSEMQEKDRYIFGVYMVEENFVGKLCEDGYIPAHSKYKISLSEPEMKELLFWNYYVNERYPQNMAWNSGEYRYFDNIWMAQILKDIVRIKTDPVEHGLAESFLKYFCQVNEIDQNNIPNPNGALFRI